jgi:hypothetical protein
VKTGGTTVGTESLSGTGSCMKGSFPGRKDMLHALEGAKSFRMLKSVH